MDKFVQLNTGAMDDYDCIERKVMMTQPLTFWGKYCLLRWHIDKVDGMFTR